ncbi:CoA transferase [Cupriavidus sp. CP313]
MLQGVDPSGNSPHRKPLAGVRVLELAREATVSSCAWILSRLGAEVLRLVPPAPTYAFSADAGGGASSEGHGDGANSRGSPPGQPHSLTIDFAGSAERELILQLAKECDVFLGNLDVVEMTRCGLDYDAVWKVNRRIIYLLQAECRQREDPACAGSSQSGLHGAIAVLGALRHREVQGGLGQAIDIAPLDVGPAARDDTPGTLPGQVARHILSDWLSLSKEQLTCLVNDGVI